MNNHNCYRIVFAGDLRQGFETERVKSALAERLHLSQEKIERLFNNGRHVLKRTANLQVAKKLVNTMAKAGAIATIERHYANARIAANATTASEPRDTAPVAPRFDPLPDNLWFRPALLAAATVETALNGAYVLLLLSLVVVLVGIVPFLDLAWAGSASALLKLLLIFAGLLVLALLGKPLAALLPHGGAPLLLEAEQEPRLHAFVESLCDELDLPYPTRLQLDNGVQVRIDYLGGLRGWLTGETVMTLGTSLLESIESRGLAAMIAAALGRFHYQGLSRANYLITRSHRWLHDASLGTDLIDAWLEVQAVKGRVSLHGAQMLKHLLQLSRHITRLRLRLSHTLGYRPVQRIVLDADQLAVAYAGNHTYRNLLTFQTLLGHAHRSLTRQLSVDWSNNKPLPAELGVSVHALAHTYSSVQQQTIIDNASRVMAQELAIEPSTSQRQEALGPGEANTHYSTAPARNMIGQYDKLSARLTRQFYRIGLGIPASLSKLQPSRRNLSEQTFVDHYFENIYTPNLPLLTQPLSPQLDLPQLTLHWQTTRDRIHTGRRDAHMAKSAWESAHVALVNASIKELLLRSGLGDLLDDSFGEKADLETIQRTCRNNETACHQSLQNLNAALIPYMQRLLSALAMLGHVETIGLDRSRALQRESKRLLDTLKRMEATYPQLHELQLNIQMLDMLLSYHTHSPSAEQRDRIEELVSDVRQQTAGLRVALMNIPYPLNDAPTTRTLMDVVARNASKEQTPEGLWDRGYEFLVCMEALQRRIIGRLASIAMQVERGLALP